MASKQYAFTKLVHDLNLVWVEGSEITTRGLTLDSIYGLNL